MKNDGAAMLVAIVALVLLGLWVSGHAQLEHAVCPDRVMVAGRTVSCTGMAGVHLERSSPAAGR